MSKLKKACIFSWCIFSLYLAINIGLGSHTTVKVLANENRNLPKEEYLKVMEKHQNNPITKFRERMIPIWNYNDFIYSVLIVLILSTTLLQYKARKQIKT